MRCSERSRIVQHLELLCILLLLLLLLLCVCRMHCCVWMHHTLRAGHLEEDERQRANALQALQNNVYTALQVFCPPLVCAYLLLLWQGGMLLVPLLHQYHC